MMRTYYVYDSTRSNKVADAVYFEEVKKLVWLDLEYPENPKILILDTDVPVETLKHHLQTPNVHDKAGHWL